MINLIASFVARILSKFNPRKKRTIRIRAPRKGEMIRQDLKRRLKYILAKKPITGLDVCRVVTSIYPNAERAAVYSITPMFERADTYTVETLMLYLSKNTASHQKFLNALGRV